MPRVPPAAPTAPAEHHHAAQRQRQAVWIRKQAALRAQLQREGLSGFRLFERMATLNLRHKLESSGHRCARCWHDASTRCICAHLPPVAPSDLRLPVKVLVLMHVKEYLSAGNSGKLLLAMLPPLEHPAATTTTPSITTTSITAAPARDRKRDGGATTTATRPPPPPTTAATAAAAVATAAPRRAELFLFGREGDWARLEAECDQDPAHTLVLWPGDGALTVKEFVAQLPEGSPWVAAAVALGRGETAPCCDVQQLNSLADAAAAAATASTTSTPHTSAMSTATAATAATAAAAAATVSDATVSAAASSATVASHAPGARLPVLRVIVLDGVYSQARTMFNTLRARLRGGAPKHVALHATTLSVFHRAQKSYGQASMPLQTAAGGPAANTTTTTTTATSRGGARAVRARRVCTAEAFALLLRELGESAAVPDALVAAVVVNNLSLTGSPEVRQPGGPPPSSTSGAAARRRRRQRTEERPEQPPPRHQPPPSTGSSQAGSLSSSSLRRRTTPEPFRLSAIATTVALCAVLGVAGWLAARRRGDEETWPQQQRHGTRTGGRATEGASIFNFH